LYPTRKILIRPEAEADIEDAYQWYEALGLMGSSELKQAGNSLHWKYVEKPNSFNPLARAELWRQRLHERFNWIAGGGMEHFGYKSLTLSSCKFCWYLWNSTLDILFTIETKSSKSIPWLAYTCKRLRVALLGNGHTKT
jgi:hypothetical protein